VQEPIQGGEGAAGFCRIRQELPHSLPGIGRCLCSNQKITQVSGRILLFAGFKGGIAYLAR